MTYFCCDEGRRSLLLEHPTLNGIDYLEVVHREEPDDDKKQRCLRVFFLKPPSADLRARFGPDPRANASLAHVRGGQRTRSITVESVELTGDHLEIWLEERGDFSTYTLGLTEPAGDRPLKELDEILSAIDFSFKVECESEFDCRGACSCPAEPATSPALDYLAKDYASFRQLILDRIAVLAPDWTERNPADLGVTLIELLAYLGDYLSYRQDAVGTEAYLGTARRRVSMRRHTALLDYALDDGGNARAWVQVKVNSAADRGLVLPMGFIENPAGQFLREESGPLAVPAGGNEAYRRPRFVTQLDAGPVLTEREFQEKSRAAGGSVAVFEPMERATLFPEHNEFKFHTWGDSVCCLPKGATKATLQGAFPNLRPGQVLVLLERVGPRTGNAADADPARRHAIRLTRVNGFDAAAFARREHDFQRKKTDNAAVGLPAPNRGDFFPTEQDHAYQPPRPVTPIEWGAADALPFALCLSSRVDDSGQLIEHVSVAKGNILLADHGRALPNAETLSVVPDANPALAPVSEAGCGHCESRERLLAPPRFRPALKEQPLTQASPYDAPRPASEAFQATRSRLPCIRLGDEQGRVWRPQRDLLASDAFAPEFVVEVENDGEARLRFGDDENGLAPGEGTAFRAVYRVGNGAAGNIGAEALAHLAGDFVLVPDLNGDLKPQSPAGLISSVTNWLPARGGFDPTALDEARQLAPAAFRVQQRAVTPADYAAKAAEHPEVQRAAATLRWTGSWHTIFLTIDRRGGGLVDEAFEEDLRAHLERFRLAGHDLEIDGPRYVPLELELRVCVAPDYFRSDIVSALQRVFDNALHPDGTRGFFHPDNFTFAQPVLLSRIYEAAQKVNGLRHVTVTMLRRQGDTLAPDVPEKDVLTVGALEIVRLDNDPNFPDRGVLRFNPVGGR